MGTFAWMPSGSIRLPTFFPALTPTATEPGVFSTELHPALAGISRHRACSGRAVMDLERAGRNTARGVRPARRGRGENRAGSIGYTIS